MSSSVGPGSPAGCTIAYVTGKNSISSIAGSPVVPFFLFFEVQKLLKIVIKEGHGPSSRKAEKKTQKKGPQVTLIYY